MIILGITGQPGSGKDEIASYLVTKGFKNHTMSEIIRNEMRPLGLSLDRPSLQKYITEKRKLYGNDYLCKIILKEINGNTTVSGFRNRDEVATFQKELGDKFILLAVKVSIEQRYLRSINRNREGEAKTFEEFKTQEGSERNNSSGLEVDNVIEIADIHIENEGTKEDLHRKIDELFSKYY